MPQMGSMLHGAHSSTQQIFKPKLALRRVLTEAVHIQKNEEDAKTISLNSKMEYFGSEMVRPSFSKGPADQW